MERPLSTALSTPAVFRAGHSASQSRLEQKKARAAARACLSVRAEAKQPTAAKAAPTRKSPR